MFDAFFGFHSIQWSYSPVSAAGAAGFAPPALPGVAQGREGALGISRIGDKRGREHMSYFGFAAPKNLLLGCSIQTSRAGTSCRGSALTKKLLEVFVDSLWHKSPWKKICLFKKIKQNKENKKLQAGSCRDRHSAPAAAQWLWWVKSFLSIPPKAFHTSLTSLVWENKASDRREGP